MNQEILDFLHGKDEPMGEVNELLNYNPRSCDEWECAYQLANKMRNKIESGKFISYKECNQPSVIWDTSNVKKFSELISSSGTVDLNSAEERIGNRNSMNIEWDI